jgi:hypothetical protein
MRKVSRRKALQSAALVSAGVLISPVAFALDINYFRDEAEKKCKNSESRLLYPSYDRSKCKACYQCADIYCWVCESGALTC